MLFKSKPRIALHGAVYGRNFGDVLIQKLLANQLRTRLAASLFFPAGTRAFAQESQEVIGRRWLLRYVDAVVFGPGGYLGERRDNMEAWQQRFQQYHGGLFHQIKRHKLPLAIFGVGAGPLSDPSSRELVASMLEYAGLIHVRDEESADFAQSLGAAREKLSVGPDIALSIDQNYLGVEPAPAGNMKGTRVGLHLPLVFGTLSDPYQLLVADVLTLARSYPETSFCLLTDNPGSKFPAPLNRLLALPNVSFMPYVGTMKLLREIAACNAILTTKLHVAICATALEFPHSVPISILRWRDFSGRSAVPIGLSTSRSIQLDGRFNPYTQRWRRILRSPGASPNLSEPRPRRIFRDWPVS